jgi:hypothetical protein
MASLFISVMDWKRSNKSVFLSPLAQAGRRAYHQYCITAHLYEKKKDE